MTRNSIDPDMIEAALSKTRLIQVEELLLDTAG
jgi:hypothetical protein